MKFLFLVLLSASPTVVGQEDPADSPTREKSPADRRSLQYASLTPEEAFKWQEAVRKKLLALLKLNDLIAMKIPLRPVPGTGEKLDGYTLREVEIQSTPSRRIKVLLTVPYSSGKGSRAAVVCIHGHGGTRRIVHDRSSIYRGFAAELASRGVVTIAANVGQHKVYESNRTLMGERLWDLMRCVDYLETLEEVNRARIGCAGLSLGGEMAMWLGAADRRITATVSSGFLTTMDQMESNHCLCWKFDGLRELVDYADIYSLIAPRALQCQNGLKEGPRDFYVPLARRAMKEIALIYRDFGQPAKAELAVHPEGHVIDLEALMSFFEKQLSVPRRR